ncbi:MAG: efflux RND transporter periplasmic adaptor subunit [Planctomycetaceae bacterium]|nr:efflux RND transporter periplasmic adaptor subunit [Planctomycetaceae bacterium]
MFSFHLALDSWHKRLALVAIGVVAAVTSLGCRRNDLAPPPVAVQTAVLKREPIVSMTRFSATVRERQRIELSFKVPGTVDSVLQVRGPDGRLRDVHEGDLVASEGNRPLIQLSDSDYRRRVAGARDRLAQVQAKKRAAAAAVVAVRANFERIKALRERNSIAQQTYDDMLAKRDATEAELEGARREESAAAVALQQAEDDLQNCSLGLPIPKAVVSRKFVERGERVPAGQPVFEIMDLSQMRVAFGVPDTQVSRFQIGQRVTVMADAFRGEQFTGLVTKVLPVADLRTRSFGIEVSINDPRMLRPGMVVTIVLSREEEMVLVPMTAVQRGKDDDDLSVFVAVNENGRQTARRRRVVIAGVYDNRIRLAMGSGSEVAPGDTIIVTGAFRLADGQAIRVLDAPKPISGILP